MAGIYNNTPSILHPHNFALQFWVEYGITGALACLALCGAALRALYVRREHPAARFALAGLAATLSVGAMGYGIWQGWWLGLLMLQLAWAAALLRPHQNL
jgi:O-antigen ligase